MSIFIFYSQFTCLFAPVCGLPKFRGHGVALQRPPCAIWRQKRSASSMGENTLHYNSCSELVWQPLLGGGECR